MAISPEHPLRIGARGSPLSLAQTRGIRADLAAALGILPEAIEETLPLTPITTTGDVVRDRALSEAGGKGLFTKELDEALIEGRIDIGVHSLKDVPTALPDAIMLGPVPRRADPRDVLMSPFGENLADLPQGAVIGTASLRRQAQALRARPDLHAVLLRGNVDTRLARLSEGKAHATFLAAAGLGRLGRVIEPGRLVDPQIMPPAPGQGSLAFTCRRGDERAFAALALIAHADSAVAIAAERALLEALDGSCRTPIGCVSTLAGGQLRLLAEILTPDGAKTWRREDAAAADVASATELGRALGAQLRAEAGAVLFE